MILSTPYLVLLAQTVDSQLKTPFCPQYPHRIWTGDASGEPGHPSHLGLSLSLFCRRIHPSSTIIPAFPPHSPLFLDSFFPVIFLLSLYIIEWLHCSWIQNPAIRACTPTASVPNSGVVCTEAFSQEPPALISELLEFESWISQFTILFFLQYDVPREGQAGVPLPQKRGKAQDRIL